MRPLVNPLDVVRTAQSYVGTPFHHQGRTPGSELDCVGTIVCSCQAHNYPIKDFRAYGRDADSKELLRQLRLYFNQKTNLVIEVGNILVFWLTHRTIPQHVAWAIGGGRMVHAYGGGKVREEAISQPQSAAMNWEKHLYLVFELK